MRLVHWSGPHRLIVAGVAGLLVAGLWAVRELLAQVAADDRLRHALASSTRPEVRTLVAAATAGPLSSEDASAALAVVREVAEGLSPEDRRRVADVLDGWAEEEARTYVAAVLALD